MSTSYDFLLLSDQCEPLPQASTVVSSCSEGLHSQTEPRVERDGAEVRALATETDGLAFDSQNLLSRKKKLTPTGCSPTSTFVLWCLLSS